MLNFNTLPEDLQDSIQKYIHNPTSDEPVILFCPRVLEYNFQFLQNELKFRPEDIFFSVKSNNQVPVLSRLLHLGSSFEIGSLGELNMLEQYGVTPNRIVYSNPVKIQNHISEAAIYGIDNYAVDCKSEIDKVSRYAPGSSVYIRLTISNEGAAWALTRKFGAKPGNVVQLFRYAVEQGLKPGGITIHVGWNNNHIATWDKTMQIVENVIGDCSSNGIYLKFIDLGGGFPAHLINQYDALHKIAETIKPYLYTFRHKHGLRIIAEPGSFLVANTSAMIVQVFDIIERNNVKWVFINSGINQGFYWIQTGLEYGITMLRKSSKAKKEQFIVTGPTCDTHDIFSESIELPADIAVGDYLIVFPAGAYINSADSYNGFRCPPLINSQK